MARKPKGDKPATYNVHVDVGENVDSEISKNPSRRSTSGKMTKEQMAQIDAEMSAHVKRVDDEVLFAEGAYGRRPSIKDWQAGRDFFAHRTAHWVGSPYFSIRDAETIYALGYRKIVFGGSEGFDVDLVMQ